jgi:hypothetical protein
LTRLQARKKSTSSTNTNRNSNPNNPSSSPRGRSNSQNHNLYNTNKPPPTTTSISSLIGRSDKIEVLRTIESLPLHDLTGTTLTAAWDRLSQRTVSLGPRAPHLPSLHTDRAFHLLVDRTHAVLSSLSPGHCSAIVGNLAKLRYRPDDEFLQTMLTSCRNQADFQTFGQAARLVSGLARLDYDFEEQELAQLAGVMHDRMVSMDLSSLHPESLSMGLWALSVLGALHAQERDELRERLVGAAICRLKAAHEEATQTGHGVGPVLSEGKAKNLVRMCRQLRQSLLFLPPSSGVGVSMGGDGNSHTYAHHAQTQNNHNLFASSPSPSSYMQENNIPSATEELRQRIDQVWSDLGAWVDPVRPSRLQMEVETTLKSGGAHFAGEWEDDCVSVDIALHPRPALLRARQEEEEEAREEAREEKRRKVAAAAAAAQKAQDVASAAAAAAAHKNNNNSPCLLRPVALEVDGPSHFFVNQPKRPTGDTKIKHQALHMKNQWSAVISLPHFEWPKNEKQQLSVLKKKLAQTGLEPSHFLKLD